MSGPACASHSNLAARPRLDARSARTEGNGSLNVILLSGWSHFHGGLYGEAQTAGLDEERQCRA
jgi:hypothetical protein